MWSGALESYASRVSISDVSRTLGTPAKTLSSEKQKKPLFFMFFFLKLDLTHNRNLLGKVVKKLIFHKIFRDCQI